MKLLLEAQGLVKTFRDGQIETLVLKGIDIKLHEGDFVALMGPSGSGKSTLLSILGTLLRPTSGELVVTDQPILELSEAATMRFRNRTLGFVFQFHHLLPDFTALENVLFPSYAIHGRQTEECEARALALLERVQLSDRAQYRVTQLSGGQKQRVAVARALMNRPQIVLADEPTGNLDRESSSKLMRLLREVAAQERTTFLISTHDPEIAAACDGTIHLVDGMIR